MRTRLIMPVVVLLACVATAASFAQNRNANPGFQAEVERLAQWTARNREQQHIKVDQALLALNPFASSKVRVQKVSPGASLAVTVPGDYPAGSVILSERDAVTLSGATMSAKSYGARMEFAPEVLPGYSRLFVVTPISFHADFGARFLPVAFIDAVYRIDLKSPDGIIVKIAPRERTFTLDADQRNAHVKYQAQFFKPGETKPFETINGEQSFFSGNADQVSFEISFSDSADSPQAAMEEISRKLADPKTTDAQRNDLMLQMMKLQQQMAEQMTQALQTDPASLNRKQDDFGCGLVQLYRTAVPGAVEGNFVCGKNFHEGHLKVAGTMARVQ